MAATKVDRMAMPCTERGLGRRERCWLHRGQVAMGAGVEGVVQALGDDPAMMYDMSVVVFLVCVYSEGRGSGFSGVPPPLRGRGRGQSHLSRDGGGCGHHHNPHTGHSTASVCGANPGRITTYTPYRNTIFLACKTNIYYLQCVIVQATCSPGAVRNLRGYFTCSFAFISQQAADAHQALWVPWEGVHGLRTSKHPSR